MDRFEPSPSGNLQGIRGFSPWKCLFLVALLGLSFFPEGCAQTAGVDIRGSVDDTVVPAVVKKSRVTMVAVWFKKPEEGMRPEAVVQLKEILASRGTGKLNEFLWHTNLNPDPSAQIYVGAFIEVPQVQNRLPDPGEFLSFTGPLSPQALTEVEIKILPQKKESTQGDVVSFLNTLEDLLNLSGGLSSFVQLLHPFYFDPLQRTGEELALWLSANYPSMVTLYSSPLSMPQWGWFSPEIRPNLELKNFRFTLKTYDNVNKVARVELKYELKLGLVRSVIEEYKLNLAELDNGLFLKRFDPVSQSVEGIVSLGGNEVLGGDPPLITLQWTPPIVGTLEIEAYDPPSRTFKRLIDPPVPLNGSFNQVSIGPGVSPATGSIPAPLAPTGYYRFRVIPLDNPQLPGIFYAKGRDYPF